VKTYSEIKSLILSIGKDKSACSDQFIRAAKSTTIQELLKVVKDNANWCYFSGILSAEVLEQIPDTELVEAGIYFRKTGIVQKDNFCIYHSSSSKHYDSSSSKHYGSSSSEHYGSSSSEHYGSSSSEHYDSSSSKHYDSSSSKHYGSSSSKHYDSSSSKHYGSSFGSVYEIKTPPNDYAIIRERSKNRIHIVKSKHEIIEY
jgi:hypothetical protein